MKKEYIEGFVKRAQELGIDKDTALGLVNKTANHPGGGLEGGMQAGGAAPDPAAIAGAAGPGGAGGGQGIPPEIEQLIDQLPPEVLAQLVQEIEQQLGGGAGGPPPGAGAGGPPPHQGGGHPGGGHPGGHPGAGGPPPGPGGMGGMPMPPKQAGQRLYVKEAAYINGFISHAYDLGFNKEEAKSIYKQALALCEAEAQPKTKVASVQKEQRNPHYDGFMKSASAYGLAPQQAYQLYVETFVNN